jgi:uncharacterized Ntn-hydrolase superfamily protein
MKKKVLFMLFLWSGWNLLAQDTFSIVAVDPNTGEIGSAGASCLDDISFPGSGGAIIISDLLPGRGAIHTQSFWNATNQANARQKMLEGLSPTEIITWLKQNDAQGIFGQLSRQYGIVDFDQQGNPRSAAYTGTSCFDWKGHKTGLNYAIQGNILLGPEILDSIEARFIATEGFPLAERLMFALQGANVVGADTRCAANGTSSLSAFIRMAIPSDTMGQYYLDLNVPSLPAGQEPIDSLQTLFNAWAAVHTNESSLEQFAVYPNPSSGQVLLSWPSEFGLVEVRTSTGQLLLKQRIERGIQPLGIQLSPGIYFVLAKKNDQGSYLKTTKIVIH